MPGPLSDLQACKLALFAVPLMGDDEPGILSREQLSSDVFGYPDPLGREERYNALGRVNSCSGGALQFRPTHYPPLGIVNGVVEVNVEQFL